MAKTICNFNKTKDTLRQLGIQVGDVSGYKPIQGIDVGIRDIGESITFDSQSGIIIYTDENGIRHQGFMYKRIYDLAQYPQGPKMHICRCQVIEDFINKGNFQKSYRFAETAEVLVFNWASRSDVSMRIGVCNYCRNMLSYDDQLRTINSSADFATLLAESRRIQVEKNTDDGEVDFNGYTRNWHEISTNYKERYNYTCEKCGISITNPFDRRFIHVHHKNGIKTDNNENNLQCLCIYCHANIDNLHKENFSYGAKKIDLQDFIEKYKNTSQSDNDDLPF